MWGDNACCNDRPVDQPAITTFVELDRLFLSLWDKAVHQPGYDKAEWNALRHLLEELRIAAGIKRGELTIPDQTRTRCIAGLCDAAVPPSHIEPHLLDVLLRDRRAQKHAPHQ